MTKPRVYQPERRFAQKANAPGGITIAEALQRADRNVAAGRERYLGAVDAKLKIAVEQAKAEDETRLVEFLRLFRPEEGRMGVTVTFAALLELLREQLIDIVQAEPYQPLHVRRAVRDPDAPALEDVEITTA